MNGLRLFLSGALLATLLVACQPAVSEVPEVSSITFVTSEPVEIEQDVPAVQLHNLSNIPVCTMYGVENDEEDWGINWLPGDDLILPGAIYDLWLPPGTWKFRLEDCQGRLVIEVTDIEVPNTWEEPTPWYLSNGSETDIDWVIDTSG